MSGSARSRFLMSVTVAAFAINLALLAGPSMLAEMLRSSTAEAAAATLKPSSTTPRSAGSTESSAQDATRKTASSAASTKPSGSAESSARNAPTHQAEPSATGGRSSGDRKGGTDGTSASEVPGSKDVAGDRHTGEDAEGTAPADPAATAEADKAFRRIVQAYENMEPANASAALVRLAERDLPSTVKTLMAMNPRKTGAVLDAMSAKSPETAAMITDEMIALATPSSFTPAR